ncbi:hypothetical protein U7230_03125 [Carboxydochorda subterranea]|uniref:Uncharacterized protein n=1 Tax=Carboxydichorda subterranea TaxID=3109565 RepID=A0ABZ1BZL5_9FIRM|nr:hypothetical protein [Limnochorda sp. L945t]WRP18015.1 hypothetical protein U7230_03125 [Limnochorda sp. L945t]
MRKTLFVVLLGLLVVAAPALAEEAQPAPTLSVGGTFTLKAEQDLKASAINFDGSVDKASLTLKAAQGELWSASLDIGSLLGSGASYGMSQDGKYLTQWVRVQRPDGDKYYVKDQDDNYYGPFTLSSDPKTPAGFDTSVPPALTDADVAALDREIAAKGSSWTDFPTGPSVIGAKLGAYQLSVKPGPLTLTAWGNNANPGDKSDLFEFITSAGEVGGPKFRVESSALGPSLTFDYDTSSDDDGNDAAFVFGSMDLAGIGTLGATFKDENLTDSTAGMGASFDVKAPVAGLLTAKAGVAFDFNAGEGNDSLAFGVGAEVKPIDPVSVEVAYTNDGRGVEKNKHTQKISGKVAYGELASLSASSTTKGENDKATLDVSAEAKYSPIEPVTLNGSFSYTKDEDSALGDPGDYTWPNDVGIGDILYGTSKVSLGLDYALTSALTVSPSVELANYTIRVNATDPYKPGDEELTGSSTTFGAKATYKFSDKASVSLGVNSTTAGEVQNAAKQVVLPKVEDVKLTSTLSVSF